MKNERWSVDAVRDEIVSAIAEVRFVARSEHDEHRAHAADWLEEQFIDAKDGHALREASAKAFTLYGGMGSFSDVGTASSAHAVDRLAAALRHGRSWFPRTP
ncbi:DUF6966 domain-containing protein [Paeniglutamicibacter sp. NPDC091659]|uniref:DUF6966 domain-containing protein n=1 Tax=Paeniglutamicibacter sp. NPDC091659 TaxID=3364389 RepID=UPI0037F210AA